jgi:hypothetical protein
MVGWAVRSMRILKRTETGPISSDILLARAYHRLIDWAALMW